MSERPRPQPSQRDIKQSNQYGGADTDFSIYQQQDQVPYYDKGGHAERSKVNAPQHQDHWKKQ